MGDIADQAAFRIMLRNAAPMIQEYLDKGAKEFQDSVYNMILVLAHKLGGDLNNPHDHVMFMKSRNPIKKDIRMELHTDPNNPSGSDTLHEYFPIIKEVIASAAESWSISPFDVCLCLTLKKGEDQISSDTAQCTAITRAGILPKRAEKIA